MANKLAAFRQTDVTRALRAAAAAGFVVARIELSQNGKIVLIAKNSEGNPDVTEQQPLDAWREKRGSH